jgi:hypothetical protein
MAKKWSRTYWADLGERVGSTFLGALIPAAVAAGNLAALDWVNALELAGSAAGISLLKGLLANMASPESGPSLLPAPPAPDVND